jgi:hypothetical protein
MPTWKPAEIVLSFHRSASDRSEPASEQVLPSATTFRNQAPLFGPGYLYLGPATVAV